MIEDWKASTTLKAKIMKSSLTTKATDVFQRESLYQFIDIGSFGISGMMLHDRVHHDTVRTIGYVNLLWSNTCWFMIKSLLHDYRPKLRVNLDGQIMQLKGRIDFVQHLEDEKKVILFFIFHIAIWRQTLIKQHKCFEVISCKERFLEIQQRGAWFLDNTISGQKIHSSSAFMKLTSQM